jgi:superfamily II DNA or RNA helicase
MTSLNDLNRVLTAHGYAIKKSSLTPRTVQALRKDLTVAPVTNPKFQRQAANPAFTVYTESPARFYVPRCWGTERFGQAEANTLGGGTMLRESLKFVGTPYDYQKAIVDQFIEQAGANGLICVPCGRGKTFMAIWTAMRLGKKFLIVVDKEFLMNQWKGELESLVPGIRVGILQENKAETNEVTIVGKLPTVEKLKELSKVNGVSTGVSRDDLITAIQQFNPSLLNPKKIWEEKELTLSDLKEICKTKGLKQSGKREELINRISSIDADLVKPRKVFIEKHPTIPELIAVCKSNNIKIATQKEKLITKLQTVDPSLVKQEVTQIQFDCTIAMIQTLVQREFPQGTFKDFGFTIFDECHHLGAAHFSRALLKVQTNHMLGLSATPIRDDGLTKVFEWFLGKPVYWEKTREPDPQVVVRLEQFSTDNPEYNEIPTDYKGDPILARLLTKIVECPERNQHIAKLIKEIAEDPQRRILVLSERIGHLETLETLLKPTGLTMSYYVGGMKEEEREAGAREARILLASYAMASEAMNIKHLNCVIMASPRKKVEQSTGRILRVQKDQRQIHPLIVDIVDSHGMYQGQWRKRAAYYKKCAYRIQIGNQEEAETEETKEENSEECLILDD